MSEPPPEPNPRPVEILGADSATAATLAARLERGIRARAETVPPIRVARLESLAAELDELRAAIAQVRSRIAHAGEVATDRKGWLASVETFVKRSIRRLVQRHLDQQREVNEALLLALERTLALVEREHDLADANANRIEEYALRETLARSPG